MTKMSGCRRRGAGRGVLHAALSVARAGKMGHGQQKGRTSKADATRRQLLDAAIEVISERGYADTTVERIVEVAGVSKGVAYYHFSSKADIATCILVEGIGEIVDDFVAIAGKAPSAVEALTAMMDSFAATIFRNAGFGRILVSGVVAARARMVRAAAAF